MRVRVSFRNGAAAALLTLSVVFSAGVVGIVPRSYAADLRPESFDVAATDTARVSIGVKYGQTEARSMLSMVNKFRTGDDAWAWNESDTVKVRYGGLNKLTYDYGLERVAKLRAAEIALSYSHTRPNGSSCFTAYAGGSYRGENIAAGYTTAKSVFAAWQETDEPYSGQGHRRNMLSGNFTAVGMGHVVFNGYHYWVQEFCSPTLDTAKTVADDSKRSVTLDVATSAVTRRVATAAPSSIAVNVGKSVALPSASAALGTAGTWPTGLAPVKAAAPKWSSGNASVVEVSGGKAKGLKAGSTKLAANVSIAGSAVKVSVPVKVVKAANPMKVSGLAVKVAYSKTKARMVKAAKACKFSKKAAGTVTYARVAKGSSKWLSVNRKTGAITVKAGAPKGKTQSVRVRVSAAGNDIYKAFSKVITVKVLVK